jgi:hypothetical protein
MPGKVYWCSLSTVNNFVVIIYQWTVFSFFFFARLYQWIVRCDRGQIVEQKILLFEKYIIYAQLQRSNNCHLSCGCLGLYLFWKTNWRLGICLGPISEPPVPILRLPVRMGICPYAHRIFCLLASSLFQARLFSYILLAQIYNTISPSILDPHVMNIVCFLVQPTFSVLTADAVL